MSALWISGSGPGRVRSLRGDFCEARGAPRAPAGARGAAGSAAGSPRAQRRLAARRGPHWPGRRCSSVAAIAGPTRSNCTDATDGSTAGDLPAGVGPGRSSRPPPHDGPRAIRTRAAGRRTAERRGLGRPGSRGRPTRHQRAAALGPRPRTARSGRGGAGRGPPRQVPRTRRPDRTAARADPLEREPPPGGEGRRGRMAAEGGRACPRLEARPADADPGLDRHRRRAGGGNGRARGSSAESARPGDRLSPRHGSHKTGPETGGRRFPEERDRGARGPRAPSLSRHHRARREI